MTWKEFVEACESKGTIDTTKISCIDMVSQYTTPEELEIELTEDNVLYITRR
jgi:hypothetical protein